MNLAKQFSSIAKLPKQLLISRFALFFGFLLMFQILGASKAHRVLDQKIFHPFVFWLRSELVTPKLDPRIKIFCYDDRTAAYLNSLDIPLTTWAKVLKSIGQKPDVRILIDKLFDVPYTTEDIAAFAQEIQSKPPHASIISFAYDGKIPYRQQITDELLLKNQSKTIVSPNDDPKSADIPATNANAYGALKELLPLFYSFGHANYNGDNRFHPFTRLESGMFLVHAALTQADEVRLDHRVLNVNNKPARLSSDDTLLINFAPKAFYQKNAYSFLAVIELAKQNKDISIIKPGDFVVILPAMYTGNTDFRETPFGSMAGGFHAVAILQSILSGDWLTEREDPGFYIFLLGCAAFFLCFTRRTGRAIGSLVGMMILVIGLSTLVFIQYGIAWSFVLPICGVILGGLVGITLHGRIAGLEEARINRELEVATLVQKSFFKSDLSPSSEQTVRVQGKFEPASECGGDWWGQFRQGDCLYILLGDAIGHGVPAALVTAVAFTVARTLENNSRPQGSEELTPLEIMREINSVLYAMASPLARMTFFIFRINETTGACCFANAGNQQPFLLPKDPGDPRLTKKQRSKALLARGEVLGQESTIEFKEHSLMLEDGDRMILFTDGIVENRSANAGRPYGRIALQESINKLSTESLNLCEDIWTSYKTACGRTERDDDATLVVIEFHKKS